MQTSRTEDGATGATADRLVGSDRVLAVLAELARHPEGIGLDDMARAMDSPKPTIHRALASLRRAGLAAQDGRGHYTLGDELIRMAFTYHEARPEHLRVTATLQALAERFGETVHYAVLDGRDVVYRAKVDSPVGAVRLSSTVGGRNPAHSTGVGKLLLSHSLPNLESVRLWVGEEPLQARTANTLTTADGLHEQLSQIRRLGYAVDDQENEPGINCIALPVYLGSPATPSGAVSVSALAYRTPLQRLIDDVATMREIVAGTVPSPEERE